MDYNNFNEFCDAYISEMVQQEIEIEKRVFDENTPLAIRLENELTALLTKMLAEEIDAEILNNLRNSFGNSVTSYIDNSSDTYEFGSVAHTLSEDGRTMIVDVQLRPLTTSHNIIVNLMP